MEQMEIIKRMTGTETKVKDLEKETIKINAELVGVRKDIIQMKLDIATLQAGVGP